MVRGKQPPGRREQIRQYLLRPLDGMAMSIRRRDADITAAHVVAMIENGFQETLCHILQAVIAGEVMRLRGRHVAVAATGQAAYGIVLTFSEGWLVFIDTPDGLLFYHVKQWGMAPGTRIQVSDLVRLLGYKAGEFTLHHHHTAAGPIEVFSLTPTTT